MRLILAILTQALLLSACQAQTLYQSQTPYQRQSTPTLTLMNSSYFVDGASGSDNNPGTKAQPWRTIQKAANSLTPGTVVIVLAGSYNEHVQITRSGFANAPITYQAQGKVITQGFTVKASYITIKGFEITNTPDLAEDGVGIFVQGSYCDLENNYIHYATRGGITLFAEPDAPAQTSNCIVRNNRLYRNAHHGIEVTGQNHLIEGNEIWGTIQYHPKWANPPSTADADGIRFFGTGHIFRGNYIHDISLSDPENINPHIDAFQTWDEDARKAGSNCIFDGNRIVLGRGTTGFQLAGGTHDLTIINNIVLAFVGIQSYQIDHSPFTSPSNLFVLNNLFIGNLSYEPNEGPVGTTIQDTTNIVIQNNIFMNQPSKVINVSGSSKITVDHNMAYNTDGSVPANPIGTSVFQPLWGVNPRFVNLNSGDFHLSAESPAIDNGVPLPRVTDDYDGNPRPLGENYDIGPYEFRPR